MYVSLPALACGQCSRARRRWSRIPVDVLPGIETAVSINGSCSGVIYVMYIYIYIHIYIGVS